MEEVITNYQKFFFLLPFYPECTLSRFLLPNPINTSLIIIANNLHIAKLIFCLNFTGTISSGLLPSPGNISPWLQGYPVLMDFLSLNSSFLPSSLSSSQTHSLVHSGHRTSLPNRLSAIILTPHMLFSTAAVGILLNKAKKSVQYSPMAPYFIQVKKQKNQSPYYKPTKSHHLSDPMSYYSPPCSLCLSHSGLIAHL